MNLTMTSSSNKNTTKTPVDVLPRYKDQVQRVSLPDPHARHAHESVNPPASYVRGVGPQPEVEGTEAPTISVTAVPVFSITPDAVPEQVQLEAPQYFSRPSSHGTTTEEIGNERDSSIERDSSKGLRKHWIWAMALVVVAMIGAVVCVLILLNDETEEDFPAITLPDPTGTKLLSSIGDSEDWFGRSMAMYEGTLVIGAVFDDDKGDNGGSAYVFTQSRGTWTQQAKLTADDGDINDQFGNSVATDGITIVIGASRDDDEGFQSGSVYIFTQIETTWTQQAHLVPSDAVEWYSFGTAVAIDGETLAIGAEGISDSDRSINDGDGVEGSVHIFTGSGSTWILQAKVTAHDGVRGDLFGGSLGINGNTIVVGADRDDDNGTDSGSVYVFTRIGVTWTEQAKITASDGAEMDRFGRSVAISGETFVAGAMGDDDCGNASGSAYIFTRSGSTWTEQAKLLASDCTEGEEFGMSMAIEGDFVVVGAPGTELENDIPGSAYFFTRSESIWSQQVKLTSNDSVVGDSFGWAVAISGDNVAASAFRDDENGNDSGSAYVYEFTYE